MMFGNNTWILLVLGLSLAACSSAPKKEYIEPENAEDSACIRQCNVVKVQCRDQARENYEWCTRDYQYKRAEYQRCVAAKGTFCLAPKPCPGVEVKACIAQYDDCFQGCGGTIRQLEEHEHQGN